MRKHFITEILCAILTLSLCACAPSAPAEESSTESSAVKPAESDGESSAEESSEASAEESSEAVAYPTVLDGARLVVFGDSITALGSWGEAAAENLNMYFFNGAMGGITSSEGIDRFAAFVANRDPDFVTLCFGMNDMLMTSKNNPKVSVEKFSANLAKMVDDTLALGAVPIILTTNPLVNETFFAAQGQDKSLYADVGTPLEWLDTYNAAARAVAAEKGCALVDMRQACDAYSPKQVDNADGIHLNATGNKVFSDTLTAYLDENFERDPDAEPVDRSPYTLFESGSESLISFDAADWYTKTASEMIFRGGASLKLSNTTGTWPDAQYVPSLPVAADKAASLHIKLSTAGAGASIALYMNGATPSAYTDNKYIVINEYLGVQREGYTGDILANQSCDITVPLADIAFPAACYNEEGLLVFSGVKIYVAGAAYQAVTVEAFELTEGE